MSERAWDAVRAAVGDLDRKVRINQAILPADMRPLLQILGIPERATEYTDPETYIRAGSGHVWWVEGPHDSANPDDFTLWTGVLDSDGRIDPATAASEHGIEDWAGTPWEDRVPSTSELRKAKAALITALAYTRKPGSYRRDPLLQAADSIRAHVEALRAEMGGRDSYTAGDDSDQAYERGTRNATGGLSGDFAAAFSPAVALPLADLLAAAATGAPAEDIKTLAGQVATQYLQARTRDDHRNY